MRQRARPRNTDNWLQSIGWSLYFAGMPFIGFSSAGLLLLFFDGRAWRRGWKGLPALPRLYRIGLVGLFAAYLLSAFQATSPYDAVGTAIGFAVAWLFGAIYCYARASDNPGWYTRYLGLVPLAGAIHALLGIYQYVSFGTRTTGIHANPNGFGTSLLIALFLGSVALALTRDWRRWLLPPYVALVSAALVTTGSRGSWLGTLAGLGMLLVLSLGSLRSAPARPRLSRKAWVAALAAAFLVLVTVGVSSSRMEHGELRRQAASLFSLEANQDRLATYGTIWAIFRSRPLVGVGLNNIKHHYDAFLVDERFPEHYGTAHNMVLQALAETGIVGTVFLGILWFCWLVYGFPRDAPFHVRGLYALLFALFVRDQFDGASVNFNILVFLNWLGVTLMASRLRVAPRPAPAPSAQP